MKTDSYPQNAEYRTLKMQGTNAQFARSKNSPFLRFQSLNGIAHTLTLQGPYIYPGGRGGSSLKQSPICIRNSLSEIDAAEIRMRAERRVGQLIAEQKKTVGLNEGGRPTKTGASEEPVKPTLSDAGIDKKLSARAQKLAAVPEEQFEGMVGDWREKVAAAPLAEIVRGEFAENMARKSFTPTEEVAIWRALAPEQKQAAKARQSMAGGSAPGKLPEAVSEGRARDKVASFVGKSGRTLEKQVAIVEAAEAEPENETLQKLVADMDRTGRVDGPHKRLVVAKKAEAIRREPRRRFRLA